MAITMEQFEEGNWNALALLTRDLQMIAEQLNEKFVDHWDCSVDDLLTIVAFAQINLRLIKDLLEGIDE